MFRIKDEMVLSYSTAECKIRNVTSSDMSSDISKMEAVGATEADKLVRASMRDDIQGCDKAFRLGFTWTYKEPDMRHCKKAASSQFH